MHSLKILNEEENKYIILKELRVIQEAYKFRYYWSINIIDIMGFICKMRKEERLDHARSR